MKKIFKLLFLILFVIFTIIMLSKATKVRADSKIYALACNYDLTINAMKDNKDVVRKITLGRMQIMLEKLDGDENNIKLHAYYAKPNEDLKSLTYKKPKYSISLNSDDYDFNNFTIHSGSNPFGKGKSLNHCNSIDISYIDNDNYSFYKAFTEEKKCPTLYTVTDIDMGEDYDVKVSSYYSTKYVPQRSDYSNSTLEPTKSLYKESSQSDWKDLSEYYKNSNFKAPIECKKTIKPAGKYMGKELKNNVKFTFKTKYDDNNKEIYEIIIDASGDGLGTKTWKTDSYGSTNTSITLGSAGKYYSIYIDTATQNYIWSNNKNCKLDDLQLYLPASSSFLNLNSGIYTYMLTNDKSKAESNILDSSNGYKAVTEVPVANTDKDKYNNAEEARQAYCRDGSSAINGCIYDSKNNTNNSFYAYADIHVSDLKYKNDPERWSTFDIPSNVPLTRGYIAFDGNGQAIFAGCYRYYFDQASYDEAAKYGVSGGPGVYYGFKIIAPSKNKCKKELEFVVPGKGVEYQVMEPVEYKGLQPFYGQSKLGTFDGQTAIGGNIGWLGGDHAAGMSGWIAQNDKNGGCPKVFGFRVNNKWYSTTETKYIFSNTFDDWTIEPPAFSFESISQLDKEATRPGCTTKDVDGEATLEDFAKDVAKDINTLQCPSTVEGMPELKNNIKNNLNNGSYYRFIRTGDANALPDKIGDHTYDWSKLLFTTEIQEKAKNIVKDAITERVTSCFYKLCNADHKKINTKCELHNVKMQSNSENATCYSCPLNDKSDSIYYWAAVKPGVNCEKSELEKTYCIGTENDAKCRKNLFKEWEDKLDDGQITCLSKNEMLRELMLYELYEANEEAASSAVQEGVDANEKAIQSLYDHVVSDPTLDFFGGSRTCKQILGDNLTEVVKAGIKIVQIVGAIIAIVRGMMVLLPAIIAHDSDGLKKAAKTLTYMAIILVVIFLFPGLMRLIGKIAGFDISCLT